MQMSRILDIPSKKLGEYMLKGWVMTDEKCSSSPDCPIPLMRSPDGSTHICVVHDDTDGDKPLPIRPPRMGSPAASHHSHTASNSHANSRASTPATDPDVSPEDYFPPPSEESIRRREQSDLASSRIGQRMLRGWAMLAEECPNEACFGVPLVRPPRKDGLKDDKKECVICGNVYVQSQDARGFNQLVLFHEPTGPSGSTPALIDEPPKTSSAVNVPQKSVPTITFDEKQDGKGKGPASTHPMTEAPLPELPSASPRSNSDLSDVVSRSLGLSLRALSTRLEMLSRAEPALLDPAAIGDTANQMKLVMAALEASQRL